MQIEDGLRSTTFHKRSEPWLDKPAARSRTKPLKNPCYVAPDADTQFQMNPTQKQFSLNRATSKGKFPSIFLTESVRN
jgi:hypothetical protein